MNAGGRWKLPPNPVLKDINWYKKQINWGELPAFYHMVASSVGELEGIHTHGFDNALKRIINPNNWNLELLGAEQLPNGKFRVPNRPRLVLYQIFTDRGFELHAYPLAKDKEIDQYVRDHPLMEFHTWDPGTMKLILRINQLHKFIDFAAQRGDQADFALISYASELVDKTIDFLSSKVNVTKVDGVKIQELLKIKQKEMGIDEDDLLLQGLKVRKDENE